MEVMPRQALEAFWRWEQTWARLTRDIMLFSVCVAKLNWGRYGWVSSWFRFSFDLVLWFGRWMRMEMR